MSNNAKSRQNNYILTGGLLMALEFTKKEFESEVLNGEGVAVIDFWAPWCGPCRMMGPIIDEVSKELEGKALVAKVNVDDEQDIAAKYGIMTIPTVLVFKNGEVVHQSVGVVPKAKLIEMAENL